MDRLKDWFHRLFGIISPSKMIKGIDYENPYDAAVHGHYHIQLTHRAMSEPFDVVIVKQWDTAQSVREAVQQRTLDPITKYCTNKACKVNEVAG